MRVLGGFETDSSGRHSLSLKEWVANHHRSTGAYRYAPACLRAVPARAVPRALLPVPASPNRVATLGAQE